MKLDGRKALVTGATGGLGHAIARGLADRGARLVLTGRRAEVLEGLATELCAESVALDLSDPVALRALAGAHRDTDVLVCNAGLPGSGDLSTYTEAEIDAALDVNLRAPIMLAHAFVPAMRERGAGHIVFMSSLAGLVTTPGLSMYNATKYGLRGFAGALRSELRGTGVGVSAIFPGFIRDAGMFADAVEAGVRLPPGMGTKSPDQLVAAVVRSIEHDRGEIIVAPLGLRLGALFGGLLPGVASAITRRFGGVALSADFAAAQTDKRR